MKNICVIGAGTYGSYIINEIIDKYPEAQITLYDVGESSIKSEKEIGYLSNLRKSLYKGLTDGRWFGYGGATTKWGGQLLTFTQNDFKNPSSFLNDIIKLNEKHQKAILKKFKIKNNYSEHFVENNMFTKTGVWLSFLNRNFFKYFKIQNKPNLKIIPNARITRLEFCNSNKVHQIVFKHNGLEKQAQYDYYFLCAGAFESARILLRSNILKTNKIQFSDHISKKVFIIKNKTIIGDEDLVFKLTGTSLITKRFVGEINDVSFYAHPVFNTEFPFFQSLKKLLFKREISLKSIIDLFKNIPDALSFIYSIIIKRKMYVKNSEWYLYIDIENPCNSNYVMLSEQKDTFNEPGLEVYYDIGNKAEQIFYEAKNIVKQHLLKTDTVFEECFESTNVQTCEDIYHPYGMLCDYNSAEEYFSKYQNMLIVTTGILPRAGGINPTAAVLPLIDEFILNSDFIKR